MTRWPYRQDNETGCPFGATREEMVHFWITYCRSALEQSAVLWSSSLSQENKDDLERTQKSFAKLVLKNIPRK